MPQDETKSRNVQRGKIMVSHNGGFRILRKHYVLSYNLYSIIGEVFENAFQIHL